MKITRRIASITCWAVGLSLVATTAAAPAQLRAAERRTDSPGESKDPHAGERIRLDHARIARVGTAAKPRSPRSTLLARAVGGALLTEAPPAARDGSPPTDGHLQPVGYLQGHHAGCGPVCDCAGCGAEAGCGLEIGCGLEPGGLPPGTIHEAVCGIEPGCGYELSCGVESACGFETGCGVGIVGDCSCDACCAEVDAIPLFLPLLRVNWCRFDFFAGVQGYQGPLNFANVGDTTRDGSGSFGFFQGFNEGRSLRRWWGWDMAMQTGVRATQSNLTGASFTDETRNQVFVTGGLFRRVDYGLQYGAVVDYLSDDWYFQGDLIQLRGELSWRSADCHVGGFQFMAGLNDDSSITSVRDDSGAGFNATVAFEPTDQYRLFYRRLLKHSGQWEAFAGWTDNDDALLGASLVLPLRQKLALSTGATYLIPNEGDNSGGHEEEGWNISLGLIWRPGGPQGCGRYCRPMFDVADNGTFLVDRQP